MSPVFHREKGYVFKVFSNEEDRKHIHVIMSVGVLMINAQGIMITVDGNDYFLSYNRVPWMKNAPISSVLNVQKEGRTAIAWPELDVDLEIESLKHPERYPLIMKRSADEDLDNA